MKRGGLLGAVFILPLLGSLSLYADTLTWQDFISKAVKAEDFNAFEAADAQFKQINDAKIPPVPGDMRLVWGLVRLAEFHLRQGNLPTAETYQKYAVELLKKKQGFTDLLLLYAPLHGLANIWLAQGHRSQARQVLEQILTIVENTLGPYHLLSVRILEQLVEIHQLQGNAEEALRLNQRIAEVQEYALMPNTPGYAIVVMRLAKHYLQAGRFEEAEPLFLYAKDILMSSSGPYHAARVEIFTSLATLAEGEPSKNRGDPIRAVDYLKSALAISENMEGANHPDLEPILTRLTQNYQRMGRPDQSRPIILRNIALMEKLYGSDHIKTADALLALAENLRMENQGEPAIPLYYRALAIFRGANNSSTVPLLSERGVANTLIGLSKTLRMQEKMIAAEINHREALEILEKLLGPNHPDCIVERYYQAELVAEIVKETSTGDLSTADFLHRIGLMQERMQFLDVDNNNAGVTPMIPYRPPLTQ